MAKKKEIKGAINALRVPTDGSFRLARIDPGDTCGLRGKEEALEELLGIQRRLSALQEVLYAQSAYGVLVVLQAIDTGGKDGAIRHVFSSLNPQGVRVISFKAPTPVELSYDYLWRIHKEVPRKGMIHIFNRSHYEDVLIARVHKLAPEEEIRKRYGQINDFEKYLHENGIVLIKILLHISKEEQKCRLQRRLEQPDKHWKFDVADLRERERWDDYMIAFEKALGLCSAPHAPWYVVPSDNKWSRDVLVAAIVLETLGKLDLKYPRPQKGLDKIRIPD